MNQVKSLGHELMGGIAETLGLSSNYFLNSFNDPTILFRIFHYPSVPHQEENDLWGVREHTDMGFLTILKQDETGGLQAKNLIISGLMSRPKGLFVINIGDMLELWTHGIFRATLTGAKP